MKAVLGSGDTLSTVFDPVQLRYVELLINMVARYRFAECPEMFHLPHDDGATAGLSLEQTRLLEAWTADWLTNNSFTLVHRRPYTAEELAGQTDGNGTPFRAETMIGTNRLRTVAACVGRALRDSVPGDLIEAGAWRGGTTIVMKGALAALGDTSRQVWVADSFRGLPAPDIERYPADDCEEFRDIVTLDAPPETSEIFLGEVIDAFERYGLLDERVRFLSGWFADTLPGAPIESLAVARLDGDMYSSTIQALEALYPKLSVGGFLIVDDFGCFEACRKAVLDYRSSRGINEEIVNCDAACVYWRRQR